MKGVGLMRSTDVEERSVTAEVWDLTVRWRGVAVIVGSFSLVG